LEVRCLRRERRGGPDMKKFVILPALAILLVIPLWAAFGALEVSEEGGEGHGGGHGAMGGTDAINVFIEDVNVYIAENTRDDGCVVPGFIEEGPEEHEEMGAGEMDMGAHEEREEGHAVVYIQALQYGFRPNKICLEEGENYEFRMMATDVTHGASIQLGPGSRMTRLPPGVLVEQELTFTEPGEYMLYCSFYCGVGHPFMSGKIIVEPSDHGHEEPVGEHEH
jgi:heme/copper-type cytochrome/quinol oxidase subunit 2